MPKLSRGQRAGAATLGLLSLALLSLVLLVLLVFGLVAVPLVSKGSTEIGATVELKLPSHVHKWVLTLFSLTHTDATIFLE